jgi:hypothetical protein
MTMRKSNNGVFSSFCLNPTDVSFWILDCVAYVHTGITELLIITGVGIMVGTSSLANKLGYIYRRHPLECK